MIVGTAGHVDHGKTSLVRALTGIDTDRLEAEKARGITIDLGFAYMPGTAGDTIGFVDVPGHERFVRTMVAGAAGIDFALLVVAGDDGPMAQTREHLKILDLLDLSRGLIAITKSDRIDEARRTAVVREIAEAVVGSTLAKADMLFVSSVTGEGIETLRAKLRATALAPTQRNVDGVFRMSVDRSFTLGGVGTIVTGTALAGCIRTGDEVTMLPSGRQARVRSLHSQNRETAQGLAGERCALALSGSGVGKDEVPRGTWICGENDAGHTLRFDAEIRLLAGGNRTLGQFTPVHLHFGASDVGARVTVLADQPLCSGGTGLAQILLDRPLPLRCGDRFVLRDQSGQHTIGGGRVLDPRAPLRKRRGPERLARLDALRAFDHARSLKRLLALAPGFEDLTAFSADRGLTNGQALSLGADLDLEALKVGTATFVHMPSRWTDLVAEIATMLAAFHAENPELPGIAGEQLRLMLLPPLPKPLFEAVRDRLAVEKRLSTQGHWIKLPDHVAQLSAEDRVLEAKMRPLIAALRFRPPRVRDIGTELNVPEMVVRRTCKALVRTGAFMELAHDQFFLRDTVVEMAHIADNLARTSPTNHFTAADFRDRVNNGRKVTIQILEIFDRHGLTRRDGDLRRVIKAPESIFGGAGDQADGPVRTTGEDQR